MGAGVGVQAELARRQLAVDEGGQIAALVAVARDRHGIWRAFDQTAQRRAGGKLAGIDHHQRLDPGKRQQHATRRARLVARLTQADHPAAAEQAQRARLVGQARGLGAHLIDAELGAAERILGVVEHGADQTLDPLAHQPFVGAVHQDHRARGIGPRQEPLDLGAAQLHVTAGARANCTASSVRISVATSCAARRSASCEAIRSAYGSRLTL